MSTQAPALTHVADLVIEVGAPVAIGETPEGLRRVVPILGGTMRGPRVSGVILNLGADYQIIRADGFTTLDARYVARADDGALVYIVNTGVRHGPPAVMERITRGEPVDPAEVYFRTTPRFETASPLHHWMTRSLFLATAARHPDRVELAVFMVA